MSPDVSYSFLVLTLLVVTMASGQFSKTLLEFLLRLTRPVATILLLGGVVVLYAKKLHYTFLASLILVVLLLKDVWSTWPLSDARRLYLEQARDQDRFDSSKSVDLQVANKSLRHAKPSMLSHDKDASPLLIFPPSQDTLVEMNGY